MTIVEEEYAIIKKTYKEIFDAKDRDSINKIYRQARVWNRFHHFYAKACTYERYRYINEKFKSMRWEALKDRE